MGAMTGANSKMALKFCLFRGKIGQYLPRKWWFCASILQFRESVKEEEAVHMDRVFNFAPGPSMLPLPVLEQVQR